MIQTRRLPKRCSSSGSSSLRMPSSGKAARKQIDDDAVGLDVGLGHRRLVGLDVDAHVGAALVVAQDRRAAQARARSAASSSRA